MITKGINANVHYLRHYMKLHKDFANEAECYAFYRKKFDLNIRQSLTQKIQVHSYSPLDDYGMINPSLKTPLFNIGYTMNESDRRILTKYRSGSHMLKINTGYYQRTPIEERLCRCSEIQTLRHVIFSCKLTEKLRNDNFPENMEEFFLDTPLATTYLKAMEEILKIKRF